MGSGLGLAATAALGFAFAASACNVGSPASPSASSNEIGSATSARALTFHANVEPILQRVCQHCHVSGGIAPFPLLSYADTKAEADAIVAATGSHVMPPWGAQDTAECTPPLSWKDDLRLTDAEIATLAGWHASGDVEGNAADAPPPAAVDTSVTSLAGSDSIAPEPFDLFGAEPDVGNPQDSFQCFVLDPKIATSKYLNGVFFVPKNKTIVHHALAFAIPPGALVPGETAATKGSVTRYSCFGGPEVDSASLLGAWAPGGVPQELPARSAHPVQAGTRFVMQVHYHPHANATRDPDATTLQYRLTDTAPSWLAQQQLIGNFPHAPASITIGALGGLQVYAGLLPDPTDPPSGPVFAIPPNAVGHVETMMFQVPVIIPQITLGGIGAHMHLAGRDEKITLKRAQPAAGEAAEQCLLQEPAWNFDWQRGYQYDAPIESLPVLRGGDTVEIRCTYDNTMANPKLGAALMESGQLTPLPISLGESTVDEMCLGAFLLLHKNPAAP